jgi:hypothetical protein
LNQGEEGLDCVLEMSSGPFDLDVGEEVPFSFCIIFGQNKEDLIKNARFAQVMYNSNYQGFTPPTTPVVIDSTNNSEVVLSWSSNSKYSKDVVTGYSDFEGYKIYRSSDGGQTWGGPQDKIYDTETNPENPIFAGWRPYAQFDLSAYEDSVFCIKGIDRNIVGNNELYSTWDECIATESDASICCKDNEIRGFAINGEDPGAPWFSLGDNSGFEQLLLDPNCWNGLDGPNCNPDSVLVCDGNSNCCGLNNRLQVDSLSVENTPQCYNDDELILSEETSTYKYKFVDDAVFDGIKYTYSIVAYDIGVMPTVTAYVDTFDVDGNKIGSVPAVISIPDPDGWGLDNSFQTLESAKGTTSQDKNFVTVIPGYPPQSNLGNVKVVPNPYIVHSKYNDTIYIKGINISCNCRHYPNIIGNN